MVPPDAGAAEADKKISTGSGKDPSSRLEFDPGPLDAADAGPVEEPVECSTPVVSFVWHSGEQAERAEDRQIITVNGYFSEEGLALEMSWNRGAEQSAWSDLAQV